MIRICIVPYSSEYDCDKIFDLSLPFNRDCSLQVWHDFRESCHSLGWSVSTFDNVQDQFDVYLVLDPNPEKINVLGKQRLKRSILQFFEPPDVAPQQYDKEHLEYISRTCPVILCCNKKLCQDYGFTYFPWYVYYYPHKAKQITPAKDRKGVCMIAANKFNRHPSSELDFRREFVKRLSTYPELISQFELYGRYWLNAVGTIRKLIPNHIANRLTILDKVLVKIERKIPWNSKFRAVARGVISSKGDVLVNAKFYVIIENMYWDGYVSEKIFDAIQFGSIPIYYGADNVQEYIPSSIFINGRSFTDPLDSIDFALSLTDQQLDDMIRKGQDWLVSEDFKARYSRSSYIKTLQNFIAGISNSRINNETQ